MIIEYKSSSSGRTMINLDNVTNIRAYNKTVCVKFVDGEVIRIHVTS